MTTFRRLVAVTLLVSFVAMATSGLMMFVVQRPSFTLQMHPVHKLFGLLMVVAGLSHLTLNFRSIAAHLRLASGKLALALLVCALVLLYGVAARNSVPEDLARTMDDAAAQAEHTQQGKRSAEPTKP